MEVILLEDLSGVGAKGATVNVKPGFARNFLLPRKLAISAGTRSANLYRELERQNQLQQQKRIEQARAEAAKLEGVEVNVPAQANEEDTLFGSVTSADVAEALARAGHIVDKRKIEMYDHIKQLGRHEVTVKVGAGVSATVKVWVVRS
jgi:large subunit ribosomal protein L9